MSTMPPISRSRSAPEMCAISPAASICASQTRRSCRDVLVRLLARGSTIVFMMALRVLSQSEPLLLFEISIPDDFGPFGDFLADARCRVVRRVSDRVETERIECLHNVWQRQDLADRAIEDSHDLRRRTRWDQNKQQRFRLLSSETRLRHGRDIRQRARSIGAGHCKRAQ